MFTFVNDLKMNIYHIILFYHYLVKYYQFVFTKKGFITAFFITIEIKLLGVHVSFVRSPASPCTIPKSSNFRVIFTNNIPFLFLILLPFSTVGTHKEPIKGHIRIWIGHPITVRWKMRFAMFSQYRPKFEISSNVKKLNS